MIATHTFALMGVTDATWQEAAAALRAAGYDHVFVDIDGDLGKQTAIDMHGIALVRSAEAKIPAADTLDAEHKVARDALMVALQQDNVGVARILYGQCQGLEVAAGLFGVRLGRPLIKDQLERLGQRLLADALPAEGTA